MKSFSFAVVALFATYVAANGNAKCAADADCASGCCGFSTGLCAGAIEAQQTAGGCGRGNATPDHGAALFLREAEVEDLEDREEEYEYFDDRDLECDPNAADAASSGSGSGSGSSSGSGSGAASSSPANGGPAFDPAGAKNVGNGKGGQFIGAQCLSTADCASGCCAGPSGICSGPGAALQAGKTGCGFGGGASGTSPAGGASPASGQQASAATPSGALTSASKGGPAFDPAGVKNVGNGKGQQFIGGQCLNTADCASGCCAGPSGICSGPGAALQAGKTGCGFGGKAGAGNSTAANATASGTTGNQQSATVSAAPETATPIDGGLPAGAVAGGEDANAQVIASSGEAANPGAVASQKEGAGAAGANKGAANAKAGSGTSTTGNQQSATVSAAPETATPIDGGLPAGAVAGGEDPNAQVIASSGEAANPGAVASQKEGAGAAGANKGAANAKASGTTGNQQSATVSAAPETATPIDGGLPAGAVAGGEDPNAQVIASSGEAANPGAVASQKEGAAAQNKGGATNAKAGSGTGTTGNQQSATVSAAPETGTPIDGGLPAGAVAGGENPNAKVIPARRFARSRSAGRKSGMYMVDA